MKSFFKNKERIVYLLIILAFIFFFYLKLFDTNSFVLFDYSESTISVSDAVKSLPRWVISQEVTKAGELPLWNRLIWGGEPYLGVPNVYVFYLPIMLLLFLFKIPFLINITVILHLIYAGFSMYLLSKYLFKNEKIALLSSIIFLASGPMYTGAYMGMYEWLFSVAHIPLILYFTVRTVNERKMSFAALTGIFLALQYYGGGVSAFSYTMLVIGLYYAYKIIEPMFSEKKIKISAKEISLVLLLILTVSISAGLIAPKLLVNLDYTSKTILNNPLPAEEFPGVISSVSKFVRFVVYYKGIGDPNVYLGLVPFILLFFSIPAIKKNKFVLFSWAIALLFFSFAMAMPTYDFLHNFSMFNKARGIQRFLIMFVFFGSILASIGAMNIIKKFKNKKIAFWIILVLIIGSGFYFRDNQDITKEDLYDKLSENHVMDYLKDQEGLFRIHTYETIGIDYTTQHYTVPLGLEQLYGFYGNIWIPEYMNLYLSLAHNDLAKMTGLLNVKYMTAEINLSVDGFELIQQFERCDECWPPFVDGPYLYENKEFMPRVYSTEKKVLIVGENLDQIYYTLILGPNYDPSSTTLARTENFNTLDIETLKQFDYIILAGVFENLRLSDSMVQTLANENVQFIPDILGNQQNQTPEEKIVEVFSEKGDIKEIEIVEYTNNGYTLEVDEPGLIVFAEKYYMFKKDFVTSNGEMFFQCNGISSCINVEEIGTLEVEYYPEGFRKGLKYLLLTMIIILLLFFYDYGWKKIKLQKTQPRDNDNNEDDKR
jgi:hypothetical protein